MAKLMVIGWTDGELMDYYEISVPWPVRSVEDLRSGGTYNKFDQQFYVRGKKGAILNVTNGQRMKVAKWTTGKYGIILK